MKNPKWRIQARHVFARASRIRVFTFQMENRQNELCIAEITFFLFPRNTSYCYYTCITTHGISFCPYPVTIGELGCKNRCRSVPCGVLSDVYTATVTFTLIGNEHLVMELVLKKWRFRVFADMSSSSSRNMNIYVTIFQYIVFYCLHYLMCQGHCFQTSSPDSL